MRQWTSQLGALVCGRTLFDFTDGWGGRHTMDVLVVVVTHDVPTDWVDAHPDAPFSFATAGVEAAVARAQEIAGGRVVAVTAGTLTRQCLEPGLMTRWPSIWYRSSWGEVRPFFGKFSLEDAPLGNPTVCIEGDRVTNLVFPVVR